MARTPLLRSIRQMMRDGLLARMSGKPVDVIREERRQASEARLSRRRFLQGGLVGGAALALPRMAEARRDQPVVAIVGGGIAGLTCALTLRDKGIPSTVYEATGRIGGRMFSNTSTFAANQVAEWGGELIDTGHTTVRKLARRYGIPLDDLLAAEPAGAADTYHFNGQYYAKTDADRDFLDMADIVAADLEGAGYPTRYDDFTPVGYELDHTSVQEWIQTRVPGGLSSPLGELLNVAYNIEYGAETDRQSSLGLLYLLGFQPDEDKLAIFGESDERFHIRGGNQRLPLAIADDLGDRVRTGQRLTRLRKTSGGRYQLTFERASGCNEVTADIVVMALPFPVLEGIDTAGAGFDNLKKTAIRELGRGHNGKITLQFEQRAWLGSQGPWPGVSNGATFTDAGYQASWDTSRAQPGTPGLLTLYSGGNNTDSMKSNKPFATEADPLVRQDINKSLGQLANVYPNLRWNGRGTESLYHKNPNAGLAYAYYKVGQYTTFGGYEGAPQGNVYFCGEHTSQDFQGYMEGGASTGKETALEIFRATR
jgi:monoamine oxidase